MYDDVGCTHHIGKVYKGYLHSDLHIGKGIYSSCGGSEIFW